ncbi:MAG: GNAT family N-acetyltransferase [Deltaproteobacteria bacterium]|nr:GNAT family N-acetyltransferase [Deltaproteobacteria bacterium]MBI2182243.1 GNAT family N-acetyltransferase [Deltaproteobacteria bacterium]MBI2230476.1 GNAT family N-acetyltransferase [Deltaproteobacteria bacterium]MBI2531348.1 GNAT family N-acetyltransferase [Deltaproteobacteria bacterium]MBI3067108.1 GNAT family N-acetyltransferase [Deltaproteobacteria bacterium]
MKRQIYVRSLERRDLPSIVAMEERVTGVARPQYWEQRIELSEAIRPHWTSLVAEFDNRFVGFLFGRAGELEFGLPGTIAWVETIGVDPAYRGRGIARELIEEFISSAEDHGIKTIFTLVSNGQTDMQNFFSRQGFAQGKMLHYQKELSS